MVERQFDPRAVRQRLGLNQRDFWGRVGVTQSGGSRYENGRVMPLPVRELLRLVHVEQIDLTALNRRDFELLTYLKEEQSDLYRRLRTEALARRA
jgi:transcriptional regulator with XRE-family HTH domain